MKVVSIGGETSEMYFVLLMEKLGRITTPWSLSATSLQSWVTSSTC